MADDLNITDDPEHFDEAVRRFRARVPITDAEWNSLTAEERQFAFKVANVAQADLVSDVWEALGKAINDGTGFDAFKEAVGQSLSDAWGGDDPSRLETIFRTNVLQAYSDGRYDQVKDPVVQEARPYLRFDDVHDDPERETEICWERHGIIKRSDDPWWNSNWPGKLHFRCRSTATPLTEEEAIEAGVTPAHEIADLTEPDDGWGASPGAAGDEWKPETGDYPPGIRTILNSRLNAGD